MVQNSATPHTHTHTHTHEIDMRDDAFRHQVNHVHDSSCPCNFIKLFYTYFWKNQYILKVPIVLVSVPKPGYRRLQPSWRRYNSLKKIERSNAIWVRKLSVSILSLTRFLCHASFLVYDIQHETCYNQLGSCWNNKIILPNWLDSSHRYFD